MDVASTRQKRGGLAKGGRSRYNAPLATNIDDKENLTTKKTAHDEFSPLKKDVYKRQLFEGNVGNADKGSWREAFLSPS